MILLAVMVGVAAVSLLVFMATDGDDGPEREPGESSTGTRGSPDPSLGIPSELPSGLESRLPSGLPTELPSELPTELPSGFPTDLPSGLPSNLPSGLESLLPVPE
ncbi:hypothetical protein [Streptomyces sp. NPDC029526]|uniref:hypothetical protein n=1 Tax=Streptomyces sp. NPDC029526 TaxID=3155728 RepID=UPI00340C5090